MHSYRLIQMAKCRESRARVSLRPKEHRGKAWRQRSHKQWVGRETPKSIPSEAADEQCHKGKREN